MKTTFFVIVFILRGLDLQMLLTPWTDIFLELSPYETVANPTESTQNFSLGGFDMLKSNLTSKTFQSATQTSKLRKPTSKSFFVNPFAGLSLVFFVFFVFFTVMFCPLGYRLGGVHHVPIPSATSNWAIYKDQPRPRRRDIWGTSRSGWPKKGLIGNPLPNGPF